MKTQSAIASALVNRSVNHGSPCYEIPEIIESIEFDGNTALIQFKSGCFTYLTITQLKCLVFTGQLQYRRQFKAFESIILF